MKRLLIGLAIIFILLLTCIYIFIPSTLIVSKTAHIQCTHDAAYRFISHPANLEKLTDTGNKIQNKMAVDTNAFINKDFTYIISKRLQNSFDIDIQTKNFSTQSSLLIIPLSQDSLAIEWKSVLATGTNPLTKIQQYRTALAMKDNMTDILDKLEPYLKNPENVYGLKIIKSSFQDTILLASRQVLPQYPGTSDIYKLINLLQEDIVKQGGVQTGIPIMNVTVISSGKYQLMVAVPTGKQIKNEGAFFYKRMVPGNFLTTQVRGGSGTVAIALQTIERYIADHQKAIMAIPFAALITDRSKEPDSAKWITKLYYPVAF